jgi:hypothetical protein
MHVEFCNGNFGLELYLFMFYCIKILKWFDMDAVNRRRVRSPVSSDG